MKTFIKRTISFHIVLLFIFVLGGCGSDDDTENQGELRADMDGVAWDSTTKTASISYGGSFGGRRCDIIGKNENLRLKLAFFQWNSAECMNLTSFDGYYVRASLYRILPNSEFVVEYVSTYYEDDENDDDADFFITVAFCDETISGTFSGILYAFNDEITPSTISVENGEFVDIPYREYPVAD